MADNASDDVAVETHGASSASDAEVPSELSSALSAASATPELEERWDALDVLARSLQRPDEVARLYSEVVSRDLPDDVAVRIGQRAVRFQDEWLQDAAALVDLLSRIIDRDASADWAFQRLALTLTGAERWTDLLALYDRALTRTASSARRKELLHEAAHVSRDFAGDDDRAILYLQQLLDFDPNDPKIVTALERLFADRGRHRELIALWTARIPTLPRDKARELHLRCARCRLEKIEDPSGALAEMEIILADAAATSEVLAMLEQVGTRESAAASVRRRALDHLRQHFVAKDKPAEVERVLGLLLGCTDGAERFAIHAALVERLAATDRLHEALAQQSAMLELLPDDSGARDRLRELASETGGHAAHADALVAAANAARHQNVRAALLIEAGGIHALPLADHPAAIRIYRRVLEDTTDATTTANVARLVLPLLADDGAAPVRLEVLERLASAATDPAEIRAALGDAAVLADALGETERALTAWGRRVALDPDDMPALAATIDLLERAQRWDRLVAALRSRLADRASIVPSARKTAKKPSKKSKAAAASAASAASIPPPAARRSAQERRADLTRIARILEEHLGDIDAAANCWAEVAKEFGDDDETDDALAAIAEKRGQFEELASILTRASTRESEPPRRARLLRALGDVCRAQLGRPAHAADSYARALGFDPLDANARAALRELLDARTCAPETALALAASYAHSGDGELLLEILEHRLLSTPEPEHRAAILLESAALHEHLRGDREVPLQFAQRAFALAPGNDQVESELLRLAESTGHWSVAIDAYREAIEAARDNPDAVARLHLRTGMVLENGVGDAEAALDAYRAAARARPDSVEASAAVIRLAARLNRWNEVANALLESTRARERLTPGLIDLVEATTSDAGAWDAITLALENSLREATALARAVASVLEIQLAVWHRDRRGDFEAAESALLRALDPVRPEPATLHVLADVQRRTPGRALMATLGRIADREPDAAFEALHEAAHVATDHLAEAEVARVALTRFLEVARMGWSTGESGSLPAEVSGPISWAVMQLVAIHTDHAEHAAAAQLLIELSRLPFEPGVGREMRRQAAEIVAASIHDEEWAVKLYREILAESPDDADATQRLATLFEAGRRFNDLLALRRQQLELASNTDARLALRLEIARVLGNTGERADRIETLRANLAEQPGHHDSIDALSAVFEADARYTELADTFVEQANALESEHQVQLASELWSRAATVVEQRLGDVDRAIECHRRAVRHVEVARPYDELARLHGARGESAFEAEALEKLVQLAEPAEQLALSIRFARALASAGRIDRAIETLHTIVTADPTASEARRDLAELYRVARAWEPLVELLVGGCIDGLAIATQVGFLRGAADICTRELESPQRAIPLLERAMSLSPADSPVRVALASAFRANGRFDEAAALLQTLIDQYGRRRPPDRALVHFELAQIARSRGDIAEALAQLDLAAGIDIIHVGVLSTLGDVARDAGELDRAERAYRMVLLIVRRHDPERDDGTVASSLGPTEVLVELQRIALQLDNPRRARELIESAFELASQSTAESRRFERALRRVGATEHLVRALRSRLTRTTDPSERAVLLDGLADALAETASSVGEAVSARLEAIENAPGSAVLHERALAMADAPVERYAELLATLVDRARESGDHELSCDLLLRLGDTLETRLGQPERAAGIYEQAESFGEPPLRLWLALDRVYASRGNSVAQARVLEKIAHWAGADLAPERRAEARYGLAEIHLQQPDSRTEGVDSVLSAVAHGGSLARAAALLRRAAVAAPDDEHLMRAYLEIARSLGDEETLLDAIERRLAIEGAPIQLFREAVAVATKRHEPMRAMATLERAVSVFGDGVDHADERIWALQSLAEHRLASGDLDGSRAALHRAAGIAIHEPDLRHMVEIAALAAGAGNDLALAAELYEHLRERDPKNRAFWEPLLDVYRRIGDHDHLEHTIKVIADSVFDSGERNRLRLERAALLLDKPDRVNEAVSALRYVLGDEPDNVDALMLLQEVLRRAHRSDELTELLQHQLDSAWDRVDVELIIALSIELGALHAPKRRARAIEIYNMAIECVPDHRGLIDALIALFGPDDPARDRAEALMRLLAIERGSRAADLATTIADLFESVSDHTGSAHALEIALRTNPGHLQITARLERIYAAESQFKALAELIDRDASHRTDNIAAASRLREAAVIRRDELEDFAGAADAFRRARKLLPLDSGLLMEHVACLHRAGGQQTAVDEITAALAAGFKEPQLRAELLRLRSELHVALGRENEAVEDLERGFQLAPELCAPALALVLERRRQEAAHRNDRAVEGPLTLRLADVLTRTGNPVRAVTLLDEWLRRSPRDREALKALASVHQAHERWELVADVSLRQLELEEGAGRIETVIRLANAHEKAGVPLNARASLERVAREMPVEESVRTRLGKLYEQTGAHHELAALLVAGAEFARYDADRYKQLMRAGEIYCKTVNDPAAAIAPLDRALKIRPGDPEATLLMADALIAARRSTEAALVLKRAVDASKTRRSRELGLLQQRLARIAADAGDRRGAMGWLASAIENDMQNGLVASELAEVAMDLGETELALKALRAIALMKNPGPMTRAQSFLRQATIALGQGDKKKAVFHARKALSEDPTLTAASTFLKENGE